MKKKIFVDGRSFDTEYQGTRTYVENLYRIIDQMGSFEIFMASRDPEYTQTFFPSSDNIRFIQYKSKSKLGRVFREIPHLMRKYKIDAAHFQYVVPPVKSAFYIVTIHDILFKDFPEEFSYKYRLVKDFTFYQSAKRADLLTTVSQYSKNALVKYYRVKESDVHIVPNGVSQSYFRSYDKSDSKQRVSVRFGIRNYILCVSRLEPRKNQVALLQAFLDLKLYDQNKFLVFVGSESILSPQLNQILSSLDEQVAKQIVFLDNVSNNDLILLYEAADMFVYPSKAEGFGIPPLEAAALQIPTICSNSTAMVEYTFFGDNHVVPDVESIRKAIKNEYLNEGADGSTRRISQIIKDKYAWESSASSLNRLILEKIR